MNSRQLYLAAVMIAASTFVNSTTGAEPAKPGAAKPLVLTAEDAQLRGPTVRLNMFTNVAAYWTTPRDRAEWTFTNPKADKYTIQLTWGVPEFDSEQPFVIELNGRDVLKGTVPNTGGYDQFETRAFGVVELPEGTCTIAFRPATEVRHDLIDLRKIVLLPEGHSGSARPPLEVPIDVPEGFEVEVAAGAPLVRHPMMACFDPQGRLFVAEAAGVNQGAAALTEKPPNKILMLEDTDGDGRFDKSTEFADGLTEPNGAAWHNGSLYVCSAPYLWRFEDTNDDGVADVREKVLGNFKLTGNASTFHGPVLGPDGRFYFCGGQAGWSLGEPDATSSYTSNAPGVFSCWPDGSDPEQLGVGGMANPVEVTFTPEGEVFGTVAVYEWINRQRTDAMLYWIYGGVHHTNEERVAKLPLTGDLLGPLSRRGHVAPAGLTRYRGRAFGPEYQDDVFLCEFNTHKVYRLEIEREGAGFTSRDEVFLSSPNTDTHFTDVLEDADGSLLVIDTGGWFVNGCPTSSVAKPDVLGAIYRVRKTEGQTIADPRGRTLDWNAPTPQELVTRLADSRPAVCDRAMAQLASLGTPAVSALNEALQSKNSVLRRNAVWTLTRIDAPAARSAVRAALTDGDASVQLTAVRSTSTRRDAAAHGQLLELLAAGAPAVRREAATALGRISDARAVPELLAALAAASDRMLEHALIYALIEIDDRDATAAGLADASPEVRRGALIALDQMEHGQLTREQVTPLLDTANSALQLAALEVIGRHAGWADEALAVVRKWCRSADLPATQQSALRGTLLAFSREEAFQSVMAETLSAPETDPAIRMLLLEVMARAEVDPLPESWHAALGALLRSSDARVLGLTIAAIQAHDSQRYRQSLLEIAGQIKQDAAIRLAAAEAAVQPDQALDEEVFAYLLAQSGPEREALQQLAAARTLAKAKLSLGQQTALLERVADAGPLELPVLLTAYRGAGGAEAGEALVAALERAPGLANVPAARLRKLFDQYPDPVQQLAASTFADQGADHGADQAEEIARFESLLAAIEGGDPQQGRALFFSSRATCSACHRVGDVGGEVGPNLSAIGAIRTPRDLLESIVLPSATLAQGFEPVTVLTQQGKMHTGVIARQTADAIDLRTADRLELRLLRSEIDELRPSPVSIMPAGLERVLGEQDIRNLLAYLATLKTPAK